MLTENLLGTKLLGAELILNQGRFSNPFHFLLILSWWPSQRRQEDPEMVTNQLQYKPGPCWGWVLHRQCLGCGIQLPDWEMPRCPQKPLPLSNVLPSPPGEVKSQCPTKMRWKQIQMEMGPWKETSNERGSMSQIHYHCCCQHRTQFISSLPTLLFSFLPEEYFFSG